MSQSAERAVLAAPLDGTHDGHLFIDVLPLQSLRHEVGY